MTLRVSTAQTYDAGTASMLKQQAELLKIQQQLATGRRIVTPADDPIAAARALEVSGSKSRNDQYVVNQDAVRAGLSHAESALSGVTQVLQDVQALLVNAGNGSYSDTDRATLAIELQERRDQLLSLANARNAVGRYLFSGYQEDVRPFADTPAGVVFQGDTGRREVQVADSRRLPITANGSDAFERIATGNGVFATSAAAANSGTGIMGAGQVADPALLDGRTYEIVFRVSGSTTTYDVVDTAAATTVSSGNAWQSGAAITIAGMQVAVTGAPADNDRFTLAPSVNRSIFQTLDDAIALLRTPSGSAAGRAQLTMGLTAALSQADRAHARVMAIRTETGAALKDLDQLGAGAASIDLSLQQELSALRDLDFATAVSAFTRQQTVLEAAQKAFARIIGRSLFDTI